ncbi:MAG: ABC transporter substrate-binding protein [Hyphomicrobium sp.]|nr:ABC transporter substrate-binding protein [Hyphomicrobium sp.]
MTTFSRTRLACGIPSALHIICAALAYLATVAGAAHAHAADHYTIGIHVSSDLPRADAAKKVEKSHCTSDDAAARDATPLTIRPEEVGAIIDFVNFRVSEINANGGVSVGGGAPRPLEIAVFDDHANVEETKANVAKALADPDLIAMVGLSNSSRGMAVVEPIGKSGVPLVSEWSDETIFAPYASIYNLTRSVKDEKEVFGSFARDRYKRIVFVGKRGDRYTEAYHDYIATLAPDVTLAGTYWLTADGTLEKEAEAADRTAEAVAASGADLIFLSIGRRPGAELLERLSAKGVALPAFIALGSVAGIMADPGNGGCDYGGALYEIAEGGISNLNNERLEEMMRKPHRMGATREYSDYAKGYGARYADIVALIADAARHSPSPDVAAVRTAISGFLGTLKAGRRVWRGLAQDWSFSPERASSERSLLVWRPAGGRGAILAPFQYERSGSAMLRIPVLYVHLDLVRIFHVDSSARSFEAEFFLTIDGEADFDAGNLEFTNAERSPDGSERMVQIQRVHQDAAGSSAKPGASIYRVSGRFRFEPNLGKYPFDRQVFSISFQPAKTSATFLLQPPLLQPPSQSIDRQTFKVEGWHVRSHYVGANERIIGSSLGPMGEERILSFYNFNYTWVMEREVVDYILRVVIPLLFIILVSYTANFIPRSEFQAIMGIQVTGLLSAIALYLALNQPQADTATLSDIIFVMAYAAISAMIVLSVLEVNTTIARSGTALAVINVLQIYLLPLITAATLAYVIAAAALDGDPFVALMRWTRSLS